jgi:hypothetical protein
MTINHVKVKTALKFRLDGRQLPDPLLHLVRIVPINNSYTRRQDPLILRIERSEGLERRQMSTNLWLLLIPSIFRKLKIAA